MKHIGTYSVARNMGVIPHPYSLQDAEQWIAIASNQSPETHFAVAIGDIVVGGIGAGFGNPDPPGIRRHSAEIGYWLGEPFWGRGIMSEAVQAFTEWAFRELGLVRLHASVFARNPASARVLAKAGYEYEGRMRACYCRDGEFIDGLLYAQVRLRR
jgi:RimJ/RimL family protein N-acetyltransferase